MCVSSSIPTRYTNMKELIKVETNEQGQKLVSGRELHEVLEIKAEFTTWMKRMIAYGFQENVDFTTFDNFVKRENSNLGTKMKEYVLTLEMAKHIAMVQRTEIGMQLRIVNLQQFGTPLLKRFTL